MYIISDEEHSISDSGKKPTLMSSVHEDLDIANVEEQEEYSLIHLYL